MSDLIRPIQSMSRVQEHGRIRLGVKGPKYPKALDTFRFTSPDEAVIRQIAAAYGGEPRPWNERTARIQNQWEVITERSSIDVWVPPNSVSATYEQWTAAGCQRRCDGERCTIPDVDDPVSCLCIAQNLRSCSPYTRLAVVLAHPEIDFGGVWRCESKSWDALEEMQTMTALLDGASAAGLPFIVCRLILQDMKKTVKGETHRWKYPKLIPTDSMHNIVTGNTQYAALISEAGGVVRPAISPVSEQVVELEAAPEVIEVAEAVIEEPGSWERVTDAVKAGYTREQIEKVDGRWRLK